MICGSKLDNLHCRPLFSALASDKEKARRQEEVLKHNPQHTIGNHPMTLNPKQKSFLRSQGHNLAPVVRIGNAGLTEAVLKEVEIALSHHELIKLKLGGTDKALRLQMSDEICAKTTAAHVQSVGRVLVIYRPAKEPRIKLP